MGRIVRVEERREEWRGRKGEIEKEIVGEIEIKR